VAVATVGLAAAPARSCRFFLRVAFGERGGLALSRTAGLGEQPLQLCNAGITLNKAVVQFPQLGGVGLEKPAKLNDLSNQLLVGVGFSARRSDARRNSQRYARRLSRWWMPLNKYSLRSSPSYQPSADLLLIFVQDDRTRVAVAELTARQLSRFPRQRNARA